LTSVTTYPNLTQNGRCLDQKARIRPTGILSVESWHETLSKSHRGRIQTISMGWIQKYTTWTQKAWTYIQKRSQPGPWSSMQHPPYPGSTLSRIDPWPERNMSEQQRTERPPEAGRLAPRRPPGPRRGRLIKPPEEPTPRGDQDRPTERRCLVEAGLGQPA